MDLARLENIKNDLELNQLMVKCTGEIVVDWRELKELQLLQDGRSLKRTSDMHILNLAESLMRFGIVNNLQVWFDRDSIPFCFDAHHRQKALAIIEQVGVEIPLLPATRCLAENKIEAQTLLLVKESKSSWIDTEVLPDYMSEIDFSFDVAASVINIPDFEWTNLEPVEEKEKREQKENQTPIIEEKDVKIEEGMLIELNRHRLLCGDSTDIKNLKLLIGDNKIDLVFSDPPYGIDVVQGNKVGGGGDPNNGGYAFGGVKNTGKIGDGNIRSSKIYKKITGDSTTKSAKRFYENCLKINAEKIILWGGNYFTDFLPPSRCWMIWDKENNGDFSDCEMAWTDLEKGGIRLFRHLWNGMSREGSHKDELKTRVHPTQKPVGLFCDIFEKIHDFTTVLDGFLGSGSTLIACEKMNRKCFAMEIDPYYCQVDVQRWIDFTGSDVVKINGETLLWSDFIA